MLMGSVQPLRLPAGPAGLFGSIGLFSIRSIIRAPLSIPRAAGGGNRWSHWGCHHCGYVASPATSFTPRRTSRPVASRRLRARLRAVYEGRLGCRCRAGGSHEARADERPRTQGEENRDLIFPLRSQKNPRRLAVSRSNDQSRQPGAMRPARVRPAQAMGTHSFRGR